MKKFAIAMAAAALLTLGAGASMAAEPSATYMDSLIRAEAQHHRRGPMHPGPVVRRMTPAAAEQQQAEAPKQDFRTQPAAPQEMTPPPQGEHHMAPPPQGEHHRMGPPPAEGHHRMGPPPQDGRQLPPPPPEGFRGPEGQPPEGFRPPHDGRHFEKKDGCPCYEAGKHHKEKKEKHHKEHREGHHERSDKN